MSTDKNELPQPLSDDKVLALYGGFGDSVTDSILADDDMLGFLRHYPSMMVFAEMEDASTPIAGSLLVYAVPTDVAKYKGVNGRSLTQKCKQDDDIIPYPYASQVAYPLATLLHASENMGKVSKGKASFHKTARDVFFAAMAQRDAETAEVLAQYGETFVPYDAETLYNTHIAESDKEYASYREGLAKAKAEREALKA